jgi:iron(III) transport system substrate-binding protein
MLASCSRAANKPAPAVVVYTSVDDFLAQPIAAAASQACGEAIKLVTDTEATKTTGLLQRLVAERDNPQCDVWWSNEALSTASLAEAGVFGDEPLLAELPAEAVPTDMSLDVQTGDAGSTQANAAGSSLSAWPAAFAAFKNKRWAGCALRTRVIVHNTQVFASHAAAPRSLTELFSRVKPGRIAMAQPQFGTTRSFFASMVHEWGDTQTRAFLLKLKEHGVQLLPGNSAVVRAVAQGSADAGLTDSDDVFVGQSQGWKVDFADEPASSTTSGLESGRLLIPCTLALVRKPGAAQTARTAQASRVIQALLSAQTETLLAKSEAVHRPLRAALAQQLAKQDPRLLRIDVASVPDWQAIARGVAMSDALVREVFPV